jgi:uncharacterized membrane protein YccF (DUF307 family)
MAIALLFLGWHLCLTIIGLAPELGNVKLATVVIAPLGKEIVSTSDSGAALGTVSL